MFKALMGVSYQVPDLEKARRWYGEILDAKPVFDSPFAVYFMVGNSALALVQADHQVQNRRPGTIAYWQVDDVDATYQRLIACGATPYAETRHDPVLQVKIASVVDPLGNIVGIIGGGSPEVSLRVQLSAEQE